MGLVLFCRHSAHIKHLEEEIYFLKMQMTHERARAERAIDTLLALKLGVPPITVPTREERMEEDDHLERDIRDPEFAQAGAV